MRNRNTPSWYLDKRVPIALVITVVIQMASAIIWATQLDARVNVLEQQTNGIGSFNEKFARIEERLVGVKQDVESIKRGMERLTGYLFK